MVLGGHSAPVPVPGFRCDAGVDWVSGPDGGVKSVRLKNSSTPCQTWYSGGSVSAKVGRDREFGSIQVSVSLMPRREWLVHQSGEEHAPVMDREGIR